MCLKTGLDVKLSQMPLCGMSPQTITCKILQNHTIPCNDLVLPCLALLSMHFEELCSRLCGQLCRILSRIVESAGDRMLTKKSIGTQVRTLKSCGMTPCFSCETCSFLPMTSSCRPRGATSVVAAAPRKLHGRRQLLTTPRPGSTGLVQIQRRK